MSDAVYRCIIDSVSTTVAEACRLAFVAAASQGGRDEALRALRAIHQMVAELIGEASAQPPG